MAIADKPEGVYHDLHHSSFETLHTTRPPWFSCRFYKAEYVQTGLEHSRVLLTVLASRPGLGPAKSLALPRQGSALSHRRTHFQLPTGELSFRFGAFDIPSSCNDTRLTPFGFLRYIRQRLL